MLSTQIRVRPGATWWLAAALHAAAIAACAPAPTTPAAPRAAAPAPPHSLSPDELRADLDQLYTTLQQAHYDLYARVARRDYDAFYATMRAGFTRPASPLEVATQLERFVAFGKVAH